MKTLKSNSNKNNIQLYDYVGPQEIFDSVDFAFSGYKISSIQDIENWISASSQTVVGHCLIATFVINENHELLINDRHSEHVMCAGGKKVISAGEISFLFGKNDTITVHEITNQSTGY